MQFNIKFFTSSILLFFLLGSCKKLVEIDPPSDTITTAEAFQDSANASSAILGVYGNIANAGTNFLNGSLTLVLGKSADELIPYRSSGDVTFSNSLSGLNNGDPAPKIWTPAYKYIYQTNGIIEGVQASKGIKEPIKNRFLGEAKFLRALFYFYLVNLYGEIPLLTSTDYINNASLSKSPVDLIYKQIIDDLLDAQASLPTDYQVSMNNRTRANHWAATALLARVYLYRSEWAKAEQQASALIGNTSLFGLNPELNNVFLGIEQGNTETILQWQLNTLIGPYYNVTSEGYEIVPYDVPRNQPRYYLSNQLLAAFESGDKRKEAWVTNTVYGSAAITYYYPYKYKLGITKAATGIPATERITVLRLAEQYLIRAEARAKQNNLSGAIDDLNIIRERAGLDDLPGSLDQSQILIAVMQERRIELFSEFGHRWLDLKRTELIDEAMNIATPLKGQNTSWQSYQQLYPIPRPEILADPNLTQNPGY